jgi:hypothetical protein
MRTGLVSLDPRPESLSMSTLADLYRVGERLDPAEIFVWPAAEHGMAGALERYVAARLPAALRELDGRLERIRLLGIYPTHLAEVAAELELGNPERLPFRAKPRRRLNHLRPWFFLAEQGRELLVAVPPGRDSLKQYSALARSFCADWISPPLIESWHYPRAATTLASWTGLDQIGLGSAATVVLGHTDALARAIPLAARLEPIIRNPYFRQDRFRTPSGRSIDLLGFTFSFWGDIAGRVADALYAGGAGEILYLGKVGALDPELVLYATLISPDRFLLAEHDRITAPPFCVPNRLAAALDLGGLHVSTPTVMEQGYLQRTALELWGPRSVDNEIAYLAQAAAVHNRMQGTEIRFSSLSFATDYVRRASERGRPVAFELADNRTPATRRGRHQALVRASRALYDYLNRDEPL